MPVFYNGNIYCSPRSIQTNAEFRSLDFLTYTPRQRSAKKKKKKKKTKPVRAHRRNTKNEVLEEENIYMRKIYIAYMGFVFRCKAPGTARIGAE